MDSESDDAKKNINLTIKFLDVNELELNWDIFKDDSEKLKLQELFQEIKDEADSNARAETLDQVRSIFN